MSVSQETRRTLQRLGYAADTRVLLLHADDVGMCQSETQAMLDHAAFGLVRCGAIMATCPWVPMIARAAQDDPTLDLGVHVTLNCEWEGYRWGALSTRDPASGLLDEQGYLWRSVDALHAHMVPEAAIAEMRAQVEHLCRLGIDLTHIDTHMGAVIHPTLASAYVRLAMEYELPVMVPRQMISGRGRHMPPEWAATLSRLVEELDRSGYPLIDQLASLSWEPEQRVEQYIRLIESLPPGITHLLFHAATPGPEIEAVTDGWRTRVADYHAFLDPRLRDYLMQRKDVAVIGYRELRELIRRG
ncbi:MAG: ChbG/HpnK family deacetylase [Chloroflexi bacterium]|jgi:predicted glycoside hydrolase/deacetylase ChbG (UPF0249 family)|nr:ChbG/HpnK family deacetylase [Chloroflexota bacterium]